MGQSLYSFNGNQLLHSHVVPERLGLKCQFGISKAFLACAREVGSPLGMTGWLRFKVPNWNLKPGSWPTETGDGSSAMTDRWADNAGVEVECHAKSVVMNDEGAMSRTREVGTKKEVRRRRWHRKPGSFSMLRNPRAFFALLGRITCGQNPPRAKAF